MNFLKRFLMCLTVTMFMLCGFGGAYASEEPFSSVIGLVTATADDLVTFRTLMGEGTVSPECIEVVMPEDAYVGLLPGDCVEIFYTGEWGANFCVVRMNYITPGMVGEIMSVDDALITISTDGKNHAFNREEALIYAPETALTVGDTVMVVYLGELSDTPYAMTISRFVGDEYGC